MVSNGQVRVFCLQNALRPGSLKAGKLQSNYTIPAKHYSKVVGTVLICPGTFVTFKQRQQNHYTSCVALHSSTVMVIIWFGAGMHGSNFPGGNKIETEYRKICAWLVSALCAKCYFYLPAYPIYDCNLKSLFRQHHICNSVKMVIHAAWMQYINSFGIWSLSDCSHLVRCECGNITKRIKSKLIVYHQVVQRSYLTSVWKFQGAISIYRCQLTNIRYPIIRIIRSRGRLIFIVGIPLHTLYWHGSLWA